MQHIVVSPVEKMRPHPAAQTPVAHYQEASTPHPRIVVFVSGQEKGALWQATHAELTPSCKLNHQVIFVVSFS